METPKHTAVLYANLSSPNFFDLHTELLNAATTDPPLIQYVFRHVPPTTHQMPVFNQTREYLTGYGVALDLKKMDYLALDDRRAKSTGLSKIISC